MRSAVSRIKSSRQVHLRPCSGERPVLISTNQVFMLPAWVVRSRAPEEYTCSFSVLSRYCAVTRAAHKNAPYTKKREFVAGEELLRGRIAILVISIHSGRWGTEAGSSFATFVILSRDSECCDIPPHSARNSGITAERNNDIGNGDFLPKVQVFDRRRFVMSSRSFPPTLGVQVPDLRMISDWK